MIISCEISGNHATQKWQNRPERDGSVPQKGEEVCPKPSNSPPLAMLLCYYRLFSKSYLILHFVDQNNIFSLSDNKHNQFKGDKEL